MYSYALALLRRAGLPLALLCAAFSAWGQLTGPSFGEVITIGATPSDVVLDENRGRLYLVNSAANRIHIYDYNARAQAGSITVGNFPVSAAMSVDGAYLYVTNAQSSSLSVISLDSDSLVETVNLPARPEGVETGADGRVLITTQGTGANNALNTLLIYDRLQTFGQQVTSVPATPQITTPQGFPQIFVGRPATPFSGRLLRTPDGQFIIGMVAINQTNTNAQTTLFVYEVASGMVLRNRSVTGQSTVLAMSPDGSRFMAGSTLYDTATLAIIGQVNTANFPFYINPAANSNPGINLAFNYGGSVFSPDGTNLYAAFNTAATGARPVANVLYISNPNHLGVRLGLKLPQTILGKMVATSDGENIFATSESGLIRFPISRLYEYPILQPETNQVFLAIDNCNRGISRAEVKVANLGGGKLTFSVPTMTTALVTEATTGVAPATIRFTMEPGRSGVVRQPGTNLHTNAGWGGGSPIPVTLQSSEAINYANTVRVYMNYRQPDQRGVIFPVPTALNNGQGLQELLLDERRERLYITNSGFNRLEIFDTRRQKFLDPIEIGQLPRSMAVSPDGSTLYVGNTGGESIAIVDLDSLSIVGKVDFPSIPRAGNLNSIQPITMAYGLSGLQFVMSNGTFWRLIGNSATPRLPNSITPNTIGGPQYMAATPGGEFILTLAGNGMAYLYDALLDSYVTSRQLYDLTPVSYFGPMAASANANYFVVGGMTLNSSLALTGGSERPGTTQFGPPPAPGQPPTQTIVSAGQRNIASVYALDEFRFIRLTTPVRQNTTSVVRDDVRPTFELVDTRTGSEAMVGIAPENPNFTVFGASRINIPPRQLAVDSKGMAYSITISGLSVVQLTTTGTPNRPTLAGGNRSVVNSNDGTQSFRPGSFITVNGSNLATAAQADSLPLPTILGGTCVTFNDVAIPLIQTAAGQIQAVIPPEVRPGPNVMQVRSLASAQTSDPIVVTVQRPQE